MKLNEVLVYVGSFRVFDIQIAIAVCTYPGVEFWPGDQRILLVFFETNALLGIEKALRNKICTVEPRFNEPLYNVVLGIERFSSARPKLQ